MSTVRLKLPAYHPGQARIENNLKRFNVMACGRRFGKDVYELNKAIQTAVEGFPVAFAVPTYKVMIENWRDMNRIVAPVIKRRSVQERRLELFGDGIIDFWSLDNPDMIRGRKYKRFIINEAGYVPDLLEVWNYIIRPTLTDLEGDAIIGGTPKGHNGFWKMYQWGQDDEMPSWASWQMTSYENPYIPKSEIDNMVNTLPERVVRQEIYAEFLDDAGGVFRRVMEAAVVDQLDTAHHGRQYVAGVDVATKVDFTVASVLDVDSREMVYMDRFNRIDFDVLENRLEALYKRFKLNSMTIEQNSIGQPVIEALVRRNLSIIPFTTTNATKQAAIQSLQAAFEHGNIKILNDPVLIGELQAFEGERTPSGSWKYAAPEGIHDDCVMSLAIAWHGLEGGTWDVY